jgi:hypothetical protein
VVDQAPFRVLPCYDPGFQKVGSFFQDLSINASLPCLSRVRPPPERRSGDAGGGVRRVTGSGPSESIQARPMPFNLIGSIRVAITRRQEVDPTLGKRQQSWLCQDRDLRN